METKTHLVVLEPLTHLMNRRTLLKLTSIGALGASFTACFTALSRASAGEQTTAHWGYIGESGPEHWAELSSDYQACQIGVEQSPIDLQGAITARLEELDVDYQPSPLKLINNGHTIQVNYAPGSSITIDHQQFELQQFHFHHPSEHTLSGEAFPLELHLVHRSTTGELAVVGVLLKQGDSHAAIQAIWDAIPSTIGVEQTIEAVTIHANEILPQDREFYRYYGSLTTPPCSEGVRWLVMRQPVEVSLRQIESFAQIFPLNARSTQALNRRFLLQSR